MIQCKIKSFVLVMVVFTINSTCISQVEYLEKDQKAFLISLNGGSNGRTSAVSLSFGFSDEGYMSVNVIFGRNDLPPANIFGIYIDGNIVKAKKESSLGLSVFLSMVHLKFSPKFTPIPFFLKPGETSAYGTSASFGPKTYFYLIKKEKAALVPFLQMAPIFSSFNSGGASFKNTTTGLSAGLDLIVGSFRRNSVVISSGLTFIEGEKSYGLSIVWIDRK